MLLFLIAIGVLLMSEPGQALLAWLLRTTIGVVVTAVIVGIAFLLLVNAKSWIGMMRDWGNSEAVASILDALGTVMGVSILGFVIYGLVRQLLIDWQKGTNRTQTVIFGLGSFVMLFLLIAAFWRE